MRILRDPALAGPCVLALGMFDGVHLGHQALLQAAKEWSQREELPLVVSTFDPHPLAILRPEQAPKLLSTLPERARAMAREGVDDLCVMTFTQAMADESPADFLAYLDRTFLPRHIVAGFNYTFGRQGLGNGEYLAERGATYGWRTHILPPVEAEDGVVSSSRVREMIQCGDVTGAAWLMGHNYQFTGKVTRGKGMGRRLGYPTANVDFSPRKLLPAYGVYAGWLETESCLFPAVVNVGRHPTLPDGPVTLEAHVLDADLTLYGDTVRVTFLRRLRPEKRFDTPQALSRQIALDAAAARRLLRKMEQ